MILEHVDSVPLLAKKAAVDKANLYKFVRSEIGLNTWTAAKLIDFFGVAAFEQKAAVERAKLRHGKAE